ncbi:MAG: hypothetical protein ACE147_07785 [Candidatus Methylomirabilales bacterium]
MSPDASTLSAAALLILAAVGVVWTIVLLALAGELRRTSQRLQDFLKLLEAELLPALTDVREAARAATRLLQDMGEATPRLQAALGALEEAGDNVRGATGAVRNLFGRRFIPVAGILAGLRAGLRFAWRLYSKRRQS